MHKSFKNTSELNDLGTRFGSNVDAQQQDFMEGTSCFRSGFVDFCLLAAQSIDLKVPHQSNNKLMSSGGFQTVLISAPPSSTLHLENSSTLDKSTEGASHHMLLKRESSPEVASPGYVIEQQGHHSTLQAIDAADYNSNSFNFSYDGSFSLSPQQSVDMKDLEKTEATSGLLSGAPSNNPSPKASFLEDKSDKMISGFEGRVDGLSPLSVIAVSAYQDVGHPSPNMPSSILSSRTGATHVLRFHPSGHDTMLSALNYSDSELGGFDTGHSFGGALDGLLGASGVRLPDLLDQEAYMETDLSPQPAFHGGGDAFSVRENSPLASIADNVKTDIKNKISENSNTSLVVDKLKVKNSRPVKATSPSRPGTQPCPTCGKVFSNSSALTKHKLTHSDERKYVCQLCAKAFKRQDHLNGHMLTHRNKKPFECDAEGCGKSYCDARSLRRHKENHHSNTSSSNLSTSQVSVIPGLAHLGFSSLQTSFPASVITSAASGTPFTDSSLTNRIQYAPPPSTTANRASPAPTSAADGSVRTVTSATSHLQFLTFQQAPSKQPQSPKEGGGLSPWQPHTINTGALLLAQNFGNSSLSRSFQEQAGSPASATPEQKDMKKAEERVAEKQQLEQTCFEVVDANGAKQLVTLTPQGSTMNLQFHDSNSDSVVRLQDSDFSRLVKMEPHHSDSSAPTTPTTKEPTAAQGASQLSSPLLQQLLNQQQSEGRNEFLSLNDKPPQQGVLMSAWSQVQFTGTNCTSNSRFNSSQDPKPVECSLCQRKFKNIPALNGHMRLHGGYFKKENDAKKNEKKNPPLQTASTNVRALIEEKINQKRNFLIAPTSDTTSPSTLSSNNNTHPPSQSFDFHLDQLSTAQQPSSNYIVQSSPVASPVVQEAPVFNDFPNPSQAPSMNDLNGDILKTRLALKDPPFRVPHPPNTEKHRRHSDSDHFILPKRPCATFTSTALADLLRNRFVAKRTARTGSDPGEPLNLDAIGNFG
ncbi:hypothetical protein JTE90_026687 [Oedothorax gibbosus]|uniref:C2H2-type domain-containing protein n=1 Tax=Oedothorax gibbosus TaxID=931172 RepID=A0AAV6V1A8_9ARAC|nr:hypothetical protein JTE90_026687 [Oedothorax gibbosus]